MRRRVRTAAQSVAILLAVAGGVQVARVHAQDGEWTLFPSAAPLRFHFAGRDYDRGTQAEPTPDLVVRGKTAGGGAIYVPAAETGTVVVLYVRDGDDLWTYGLVGGP